MTAPLVLALFALLTTHLAPRHLMDAKWTVRSPSAAILVWQAVSVAVAISILLIGLTLALPILPISPQLSSLVRTTHLDVIDHYETPAGNGLALLALVATTTLTTRVVVLFALSLRRAALERRAQMEGLSFVGTLHPSGYTVIDYAIPLVYCLPGRHRAVVLTSAAVAALSPEELTSVLAHERSHLRARHDLALTFSAALARSFRGVSMMRTAHQQIAILAEMQADDAAQSTASRRAMASALVTLGTAEGPTRPSLSVEAPVGSTTSRVRRLVGAQRRVLPRQRVAVGVGVLTLLITPVALALSPALEASARDCCHVAMPIEQLSK